MEILVDVFFLFFKGPFTLKGNISQITILFNVNISFGTFDTVDVVHLNK